MIGMGMGTASWQLQMGHEAAVAAQPARPPKTSLQRRKVDDGVVLALRKDGVQGGGIRDVRLQHPAPAEVAATAAAAAAMSRTHRQQGNPASTQPAPPPPPHGATRRTLPPAAHLLEGNAVRVGHELRDALQDDGAAAGIAAGAPAGLRVRRASAAVVACSAPLQAHSHLLLLKLSTMVTANPALTSSTTVWEPMKPAPPVTRMFFVAISRWATAWLLAAAGPVDGVRCSRRVSAPRLREVRAPCALRQCRQLQNCVPSSARRRPPRSVVTWRGCLSPSPLRRWRAWRPRRRPHGPCGWGRGRSSSGRR